MTARALSKQTYNALKTAIRQLIVNSGGVKAAATLTRVQHAQLGVYQNINEPNQFAPIDVIADLETFTGDPVVTKALCEMNGGYFVPIDEIKDSHAFPTHLANMGKENSDVFALAGSALSDGKISKDEAMQIIPEIAEAINALAAAKANLEGIAHG